MTVLVTAWQATDTSPGHHKFYRAYVAGSRLILAYGRIGSPGTLTVSDHPHPVAAVNAAISKLESKVGDRKKAYSYSGDPLLLHVADDRWDRPKDFGSPAALNTAWDRASTDKRMLSGSLVDGQSHVVAYPMRDHRIATPPVAFPVPALGMTLAVMTPAQAAAADRSAQPRMGLFDLGVAQPGDDVALLQVLARLWQPSTPGPMSRLDVALQTAREVCLPSGA